MKSTYRLLKIKEIEEILGVKIKNKNIWLTAITHKSWLFFRPEVKLPHNERLEFLGDSVLQLITSWYLYLNFPHLGEGELSLIRAALVNRQRLGEIAQKLKIEKFILLGKNLNDKGLKTILGDSLEAIIGAIFLDLGFEKAKEFVEKNILAEAEKIVKEKKYKDPKSLLQEIFQQKYKQKPEYRLIEITGPPHQRNFKVALYFKNKKLTEGQGSSKKEAEINAAIEALRLLY
ncbi:MAG: ribonuclease 3 [Candidatus Parcubacteria bacterium]|nr:MAG: ribonuclease 3 [Candidatus Parcubacteria bacterium]